jgi:hypothetical protein
MTNILLDGVSLALLHTRHRSLVFASVPRADSTAVQQGAIAFGGVAEAFNAYREAA